MSVKITNFEMPASHHDWGILQINHLNNTYYRFDMTDGQPVLDTSFFADAEFKAEEKHRTLRRDSQLYQDIQQALSAYVKEHGYGR